MRAVFLILVLLSGWLTATPALPALSAPGDEAVQTGGHEPAAPYIARVPATELVRSLELRRPQPNLNRSFLLFPAVAAAFLPGAPTFAAAPLHAPVDLARAFAVLAQPIVPGAPPASRG